MQVQQTHTHEHGPTTGIDILDYNLYATGMSKIRRVVDKSKTYANAVKNEVAVEYLRDSTVPTAIQLDHCPGSASH